MCQEKLNKLVSTDITLWYIICLLPSSKCIHLLVREGEQCRPIVSLINQYSIPRMDVKDSPSDVIYPNIMFCVDNFEDVFSEMHCNIPGEKIAVQLIASTKVSFYNFH